MFNAKEYLAGQTPPVFVDTAGREHVGRILSLPEMAGFFDRFDALQAGDWKAVEALVREFCAALDFPAEEVLKLPIGGVLEAFRSFFESQPLTPRTKGTAEALMGPTEVPGTG